MTKCNYCDEEIEFRYINGQLTPIHTSNNWCNGKPGSAESTSQKAHGLCRETPCPKCGELVYFIKHNNGSVWVDELGWPWPKHSCMYSSDNPAWLNYFNKKLPEEFPNKTYVGVIVGGLREGRKLILAIDAGKQGRMIISTEGTTTVSYLKGAIVVLVPEFDFFLSSTFDVKPILEIHSDASIINFPANWATIFD